MRVEFHVVPDRPALERILPQSMQAYFDREPAARLLLCLADAAEMQHFDDLLWEALPFLPHAPLQDEWAPQSRVHLLCWPEQPPRCDALWHYGRQEALHPPAGCRLLLEWVCAADVLQVQASRRRYRHYQQLKLSMDTIKHEF